MMGMTHAAFVRSPHAHAKIKSIDVAEAKEVPGVVDVLTGADLAADGIGGLICGWMIKSKDGSPMKAGAHPAMAKDMVRYVGDPSPWSSPRPSTRRATRPSASWSTTRSCRRSSIRPRRRRPARRRSIRRRRSNLIFDWAIGDEAATDAAFAKAAHVTKLDIVNNRLVPNAMEPRAALGVYDPAEEQLHALYDQPEPARRSGWSSRPSSASRRKTSSA